LPTETVSGTWLWYWSESSQRPRRSCIV
jgi:hypothetical protein